MTSDEAWCCKAAGMLKRRPCEEDEGDEAGGATQTAPFTAHWGATPCIKIVRTMGLDLSILGGVPTPIVRMIRSIDSWLPSSERGIMECERALGLNPSLASAHAMLGLAKYLLGQGEETEKSCRGSASRSAMRAKQESG